MLSNGSKRRCVVFNASSADESWGAGTSVLTDVTSDNSSLSHELNSLEAFSSHFR